MFEDATFHSSNIQTTQTPKWMFLALTVNLTILTAMIVVPLLYPNSLPTRLLMRTLYAPSPAPVQLVRTPATPAASHALQLSFNPFLAPPVIPINLDNNPGNAPALVDPFSIATSGNEVAGATPNTDVFRTKPPQAAHPAQPRTAKISQGVAAGLLMSHPLPTYPPIAKATGTSGTVVLAATISTSGTIENLRVLSGSPMLTAAAVEAVKTWRYRPYQLNNQPVEVETTINVVFSMEGRSQ